MNQPEEYTIPLSELLKEADETSKEMDKCSGADLEGLEYIARKLCRGSVDSERKKS